MKRFASLTMWFLAASLLVSGVAWAPSTASAAGWIRPDNLADTWVSQIERELNKKAYRFVFANDPRTPQVSVVRLLDQAARAMEANNPAMAKDLVHQAISVLEEGVRNQYYSSTDVEPIISFIRTHAPVKEL